MLTLREGRILRCCFKLLDISDFLERRTDDDGLGTTLLGTLYKSIRLHARVLEHDRLRFSGEAVSRLKILSRRRRSGKGINGQANTYDEVFDRIVGALHMFLPVFEDGMVLPARHRDLLRCPRHTQTSLGPDHLTSGTVEAMRYNSRAHVIRENLNRACRVLARHNWARVRALLPDILSLKATTDAP